MLVLLALSSFFVTLEAHSTGAPELGCYTSQPLHEKYMPQYTHAPYVLEFNPPNPSLKYTQGKPISLRLRSTDPQNHELRGYLVTVTSSSGFTGGTWQTIGNDSKAIPDCGITQTGVGNNRTFVDMEFTPSKETHLDMESIQFKAIAVHNVRVFWNSILSPVLTPKEDNTFLPVGTELDKLLKEFQKYATIFDFSTLGGLDAPQSSSSTSTGSSPSAASSSSSSNSSRRSSKSSSKVA